MRRGTPEFLVGFALICISVSLACVPLTAFAASRPRVVLIDNPDSPPSLKDVLPYVRDSLGKLNVRVDTISPDVFPLTQEEWETIAAEQSRLVPGTLAVFGWNCRAADNCSLFVVETRHLGLVAIPVRPASGQGDKSVPPDPAQAMAATIRETVYGSLLLELDRVAAEGESPSALPAPDKAGDKPAAAPDKDAGSTSSSAGERWRSLFWLEGAYIGEFPFPDDNAIHGVRFGAAMYPTRHVAPTLHLGWMGVRSAESPVGEVRSSLIPIEVAVRILIPVGIATFSLAPTARIDLVISGKTPEGESKIRSTSVDLLLGGMTCWNIPMPVKKMELLLGAGLLFTVVGHDLVIEDQVVLEESPVRLMWVAGLTFGL